MKLSELENSLIAKDLIFMKIVQLPRSRMAALRGQEVNIPLTDTDIKNTVSQLPRTPDEASLIPVQLKRKQAFRNAHLKEYISPSKIKQALTTLKLLGHKHYQFNFDSDLESFEQRMEIEAEKLQQEEDVPVIHQVQDEILPEVEITRNIDSSPTKQSRGRQEANQHHHG